MSTVYLAEHVLIKRRVAVKLLREDLVDDSEAVERFMNEASAAGTLGHPNIVESTDMGFTRDGVPFIVFEYLEGALLTEEIYRVNGMTVRRACQIALQIASALQAAHEAGIVHRDLKSDNIFLCARDGHTDHVKVLDFGVSRFLEAERDSSRQRKIIGTPEFLAPEQILHPEKVDCRVDVYALGLVMYEMLTARRAFASDGDTDDLLRRIVREPPPPIGANDAPPALQELLLDRMLAKDPERRPASMLEVEKLIAEIGGQSRPSKSSIPPVRKTPLPGEINPPLTRTPLPSKTITNLAPPPARTLENVPPITRSVDNLRPPRASDPAIVPPKMAPSDPAIAPPSETSEDRGPGVREPPAPIHISFEGPPAASLPLAAQTVDLPHEARPRRTWMPILAVSLLALAAGVTSLFVGQETVAGTSNTQGLQLHADKLANTFEQAVSALRLRAESIASSPMLRAAVETDAATLRDMMRDRDFVFAAREGETLEIFARKAGKTTSLLRLPEKAEPLAVVDRAELQRRGGRIVVHAGVPVGASGVLVLAAPVDLAPVRENLASVVSATLLGFDQPYPVKEPAAKGPTEEHRFPVTVRGDARLSGTLVLTIPVPPSHTVDRYAGVRTPAFAVGGISLLLGLILLLKQRR